MIGSFHIAARLIATMQNELLETFTRLTRVEIRLTDGNALVFEEIDPLVEKSS